MRHVWMRRMALKMLAPLRNIPMLQKTGYTWEMKLMRSLLEHGFPTDVNEDLMEIVLNKIASRWGQLQANVSGSGLKIGAGDDLGVGFENRGGDPAVNLPTETMFEGDDSDDEPDEDPKRRLRDRRRQETLFLKRYFDADILESISQSVAG